MTLPVQPVSGLDTFWAFVPSERPWAVVVPERLKGLIYARRRPAFSILKPLRSVPQWIVYFLYLPDAKLQIHHHFTLGRLKDLGIPLMTICAAPSAAEVPDELLRYSDAACWKAVTGYDFSAYTVALELIARYSQGAEVIILNDSMFGPFRDLRPFLSMAPWELTGFTASGLTENHIQSYGFVLRDITCERLAALRSVLFKTLAFNRANQVIAIQELRFARVAARSMTVGAYWYAEGKFTRDPCLQKPFELLAAGFPFMKRSLLGKMQSFQNTEMVISHLQQCGHPI